MIGENNEGCCGDRWAGIVLARSGTGGALCGPGRDHGGGAVGGGGDDLPGLVVAPRDAGMRRR